MEYQNIIHQYANRFDELETFFEGGSRILKVLPKHPDFLLSKLKPTIFSRAVMGPIELIGIAERRTKLDRIFSDVLHKNGVQTSSLATEGECILVQKEQVPPIEVVVKAALVGSPKHIYKGISDIPTRHGGKLTAGEKHEPYVRFDWRNPLPDEDLCMPEGLADQFIDTTQAKKTALLAFASLKAFLNQHELDLLDICFFMNEAGSVICAENSTDNTNIVYVGSDTEIQKSFQSKEKPDAVKKADAILDLCQQL